MPIHNPVEKRIHQAFEIGIALKGFNAFIEVVLGLLLLFTNVTDIVQAMIENELIDDPHSFFALHVQPLTQSSQQAEYFGALYLLSHGIVKIVLISGLLRNKLWAYPASLAVLSLFILYQIVRYLQTHSTWLLFVTAFDLLIIWLVWQEYRRIRGLRVPAL